MVVTLYVLLAVPFRSRIEIDKRFSWICVFPKHHFLVEHLLPEYRCWVVPVHLPTIKADSRCRRCNSAHVSRLLRVVRACHRFRGSGSRAPVYVGMLSLSMGGTQLEPAVYHLVLVFLFGVRLYLLVYRPIFYTCFDFSCF